MYLCKILHTDIHTGEE